MSKIDICISIIQTIKDYLFSTEKLKKHHEKKAFFTETKAVFISSYPFPYLLF